MIVKFLAVTVPPFELDDCRQELAELLSAALNEHFESYGDDSLSLMTLETAEMINLTLLRHVLQKNGTVIHRIIYGFEIEFSIYLEDYEPREKNNVLQYLEDIIKRFGELIRENESVKHLLKFYDDVLLEQNLAQMREVFDLEMKLRQILSMIYLSAFDDENFYNLLRNEKAQPRKSLPKDEENMKEIYENEFYHLTFGQYPLLNDKKKTSEVKDLIELLLESNNIEELKDKLTNNSIYIETDADMISSLRETSPKIEEFRNCVAHNRKITDDLLRNYIEAKGLLIERLTTYLDDFSIVESD